MNLKNLIGLAVWRSSAFAVVISALISMLHPTLMAAAGVSLPPYTTNRLENGMTVLLMERHELPLVSFVWIMKSGASVLDPEGVEGTASLTAQMLRKGTKTRTADQISELLDFSGASFGADASHLYAFASAEFLSKDLPTAVELLADLTQNPTFPEDELAKMIKQEADGITEAKEVPGQVIGRYFKRFLFSGHPYGRASGGTETSLAKITREQVIAFHKANYSPSQMILAVVGDFQRAELAGTIQKAFGNWAAPAANPPNVSQSKAVQGRRALIVEKPDATQTFFRIGATGPKRTDPDWVPLTVVNTLFGGRFTSMLNSALRIESGLTYGASSQFAPSPVSGDFVIASFTKNETTSEALKLALKVLANIHEQGVTPEQLQSAKTYIKGQFGPDMETNDQLARLIAELAYYGLGADYIASYFQRLDEVSVEKARELIRKHYPKDEWVMVLIGKQEVVQPAVRSLVDHVETKLITEPGF